MSLTISQKEKIVTLLEESVIFQTRLKDTIIYLASLEAQEPNNKTFRNLTLSIRKQFYELSAYMKTLEEAVKKPDLHSTDTRNIHYN